MTPIPYPDSNSDHPIDPGNHIEDCRILSKAAPNNFLIDKKLFVQNMDLKPVVVMSINKLFSPGFNLDTWHHLLGPTSLLKALLLYNSLPKLFFILSFFFSLSNMFNGKHKAI